MTTPLGVEWAERTPEGHRAILKCLKEKQASMNIMPMKKAWPREAQSCKIIKPILVYNIKIGKRYPLRRAETNIYINLVILHLRRAIQKLQAEAKQGRQEWAMEAWHLCSDCGEQWKVRLNHRYMHL